MNNVSWARALMLGALVATTGCSGEDDGPPPRAACIVDGAGGVEICVREQGPALSVAGTQPVVMLAGQPHWDSEYLQDPIQQMLARGPQDGYSLRIATYDYRGVGRTPAPNPPSYFLEDYANDLEAVRKKLGTEQIVVFAHGWGALVAYEYLRLYPDRLKGLILANAYAIVPGLNTTAQKNLDDFITYTQEQGFVPTPLPPDDGDSCTPPLAASIQAYFHSFNGTDYQIPQTVKEIGCTRSVKNTVEGVLINTGYEFFAATNAFTGPVLHAYGKSDPRDSGEVSGNVGSAFPNAQQYGDNVNCNNSVNAICDVSLPGVAFFPWYEGDDLTTPDVNEEGEIFFGHIRDFFQLF